MKTAEQMLQQENVCLNDSYKTDYIVKQMIEFAKLHVNAALKSASKKAFVEFIDLINNEKFDYTDVLIDDNIEADVNKDSILNAYPLNKIK